MQDADSLLEIASQLRSLDGPESRYHKVVAGRLLWEAIQKYCAFGSARWIQLRFQVEQHASKQRYGFAFGAAVLWLAETLPDSGFVGGFGFSITNEPSATCVRTNLEALANLIELEAGRLKGQSDSSHPESASDPEDADSADVSIDKVQLAILEVLYDAPSRCTIDNIEASARVSRITACNKTKALITLGLVERPEGRNGGACLTKRGRRVVESARTSAPKMH